MGKKIIFIGVVIFALGMILALYGMHSMIEGSISKRTKLEKGESLRIELRSQENIILFFAVNCSRGRVAVEVLSPNGTSLNSTVVESGSIWKYTIENSSKGVYILKVENIWEEPSDVEYSAYKINYSSMYLVFAGIILSILSSMVMILGTFIVYKRYRYGGVKL